MRMVLRSEKTVAIRNVVLLAITSILLIFSSDISTAADAGKYKVIHSRHDSLCDYAAGVLNKDLIEHGFVASPSHDPFSDIKWTKMRNSYANSFQAIFDIDNDGHEETVIR